MANPSNVVSINDPVIPVDQNIYEESTTQKTKLGTRLQVGERVFRYAQLSTSANVGAGYIVSKPQLVASHQSGIVSCAATSAGANVITVTMGTAMTLNQYAEGYLVFASQALSGGGMAFKIKSNPAIATAATGSITLYDTVPVAVAAGPVNFVPSEYSSVKVGSQALDCPIGVTVCAVTTGNYCWLQTFGPGAVRHQAATPANAVIHMGTLGQALCTFDATTNGGTAGVAFQIGKNSNLAATATQANPVYLSIAQ